MNAMGPLPDTEAKLRFLEGTLAPRHRGEPAMRLETHMSWLLLGSEQVLKLKKPVRHRLFDFTTVQARERNAREELRLNRRLAPRIYLHLLALQWDGRAFSLVREQDLPAPGDTVEWLVAMQRLPAERMLDQIIARGALASHDEDALLDVLVPFYRHAPRPDLDADEYLSRLHAELAEDRRVLTLPRFALPNINALLDRMDHALAAHEGLLRQRASERRIVEGHGDLRPEHICLIDPPVVIDALEFDARLREVDPFDELCFLGLECAMIGDDKLGPRLVARCADALDDHPHVALLHLHTACRALLRARLSAAHLLDDDVRTPQKWLPRAQRYLMHAGAALHELDGRPAR